ncbi:hypothetical protein MA16_Dca005561 [Dendrobium catenatum]|uniref:Uncharacterized protein n=1 Tax=Dendrobium catenatum TaxID=906689 RepID=A0A2I0WPY6_9ASPA|nr:hypothetical protein MA16_Dca005561 [Dendrobium catenatum]
MVDNPSSLAALFVRIVGRQISPLEWKLEWRIVVFFVVDRPSPSASIIAQPKGFTTSIMVDNPSSLAVHRSSQAPGSDTN